MEHNLTIKNDGSAMCECGRGFLGTNTQMLKGWEDHYATTVLLVAVRESALEEQRARVSTEVLVTKLIELGVPANKIANAIGRDPDNNLILSTYKVQSIANKYAKAQPAPVQKTTKKVAKKKA